jgi:hypothetical protein
MADAELHEDEARRAGVEAEILTRAAGTGFTLEFGGLQDALFKELVDYFSSGDATCAGDFSELTSCSGGHLHHVAEDESAVNFAEAGGYGGGLHGLFIPFFSEYVKCFGKGRGCPRNGEFGGRGLRGLMGSFDEVFAGEFLGRFSIVFKGF